MSEKNEANKAIIQKRMSEKNEANKAIIQKRMSEKNRKKGRKK
jgi:hypothetical protein